MSTILHSLVLAVPADDPGRAVASMLKWAPWWAQWYWSEGGGYLLARLADGTEAYDAIVVKSAKTGPVVPERTLEAVLKSRPTVVRSPRWDPEFHRSTD